MIDCNVFLCSVCRGVYAVQFLLMCNLNCHWRLCTTVRCDYCLHSHTGACLGGPLPLQLEDQCRSQSDDSITSLI